MFKAPTNIMRLCHLTLFSSSHDMYIHIFCSFLALKGRVSSSSEGGSAIKLFYDLSAWAETMRADENNHHNLLRMKLV